MALCISPLPPPPLPFGRNTENIGLSFIYILFFMYYVVYSRELLMNAACLLIRNYVNCALYTMQAYLSEWPYKFMIIEC